MTTAAAQPTTSVGDALANARRLLATHPDAAAGQARAIIQAEPGIAEAHLILAAALRVLDLLSEAEIAEREGLRVSAADPVLAQVKKLLSSNRLEDAESLLRQYLDDTPNDPEGLRLLAKMAVEAGHLDRAERLLWRALALAPNFSRAKADFEDLIERQARAFAPDASRPPTIPEGEEEFRTAIRLNEEALEKQPRNPQIWLGYGHVLRIAGRQGDSVSAYRKAIELNPSYGEAWWSLADLKTAKISETDMAAMRACLDSSTLAGADEIGLHFALGKALGDAGRYEEAFKEYSAGNSLKHKSLKTHASAIGNHVQRCEEVFTREYFSAHGRSGHEAKDPIFIVGMPRSGSTLIEQILASHPSIEGTEELVYLGNLASLLSEGRKAGIEPSKFVDAIANLPSPKLDSIGGAYLWNADKHRHSNRPRFIDKMPRNWLYLPLIKLALPNAKIIDVRRNPMDCCWSNFRQLFADSGEFSYDLAELGDYYRSYVRMLAHFDRVLPGMVHRVIYEHLVTDTDREVRRLLDYLDLPFDAACLEFHKNPRAVKTSSSEQVRQPITDAGIDQWRPYDPWLGPLKEALGSVLQCYPNVPENWN
ncbi:sulfotransferase [Sphingomonas sp. G124]|uniref:Sulfotransferase n=1 Tax=Sphingomonas cremea TaxID=2904799 RepID=A0A9X1U4E2_9SPHN|nr:sulfotransferase [Sphingomonas cremea]MCF2514106.1 sulfotransferase [Sphingomonas cremea]